MSDTSWKEKAAFTRARAAGALAQVPPDGSLRFSLLLPHALLEKLGVEQDNPPTGGAVKAFYTEASQTLVGTEPAEYERMLAGDPGTCTIIEYTNPRGERCRKMVCYDEFGNEHIVWDVCETPPGQ